MVSTCTRQRQNPCACTTHTCCRQGDRCRHCAACGARSLRFSQRGNALPSEKNSDLATTFDVRRGLMSSPARRAREPGRNPPIYEKHSTIFLTYHTVPKTYLAVKDRELVSHPTNRSARNGQNTKSFSGVRLLTTACAWHGPFTPAHGVSQNRPKKVGSKSTNIFYNRVDDLLWCA